MSRPLLVLVLAVFLSLSGCATDSSDTEAETQPTTEVESVNEGDAASATEVMPTVTFDGTALVYTGPDTIKMENGSWTILAVNNSDGELNLDIGEVTGEYPGAEAAGTWFEEEWTPGTPPPWLGEYQATNLLAGWEREIPVRFKGTVSIEGINFETMQHFSAGVVTVEE